MLQGNLPGSILAPEIANMDGYINIIRYDDTVGIRIEPEDCETGKVCKQCMEENSMLECPYGKVSKVSCLVANKQRATSLRVGNGQYVQAGDQLTNGFLQPSGEQINARFVHPDLITSEHIPDLAKLLRTKQIIWLDCYFYTFKENNIFINPRHFEIFARLQLFKVTVLDSNHNALAKTDDGSINFLQGGRYDYSVIAKSSNKPKKFAIRTSTIEEVVTDNSGLLTALSFEDVPKLLAQFANEKRKVDVRYNNAIIGGLNVGANLEHLKTQPKMLHKPAVIQKFNQEKPKPNGPLIETFYTAGSESSSLDQLDLTGALDDLMSLGSLGSVASDGGDNLNLGDSLGSLDLGENLDALAPETTEGTNLDGMNSFGLDFDDDDDDDDSISNDFNFEKEGTRVGGMDLFSQGLTQSAEEFVPSTPSAPSAEDPKESTSSTEESNRSDINPDFTKFFAEEKPIPDFSTEDDSEEYEINYNDDDSDDNPETEEVEEESDDKEGSKGSKTMSLF